MAFRFEELEVWEESLIYSKRIYSITKGFPREELFSLIDQLRRSANSIAANIAEGSGSGSKKDFAHYLDISIKSTFETVSHLYLAKELNYINEEMRKELYMEAEILVKRIKSYKNWLLKAS